MNTITFDDLKTIALSDTDQRPAMVSGETRTKRDRKRSRGAKVETRARKQARQTKYAVAA